MIGKHVHLEQTLAARKPAAADLAVNLSALLPAGADDGWHDARRFAAIYERLLGDRVSLDEFLKQIDEDFFELSSMLKLRPTGTRLSSRLAGLRRPARVSV